MRKFIVLATVVGLTALGVGIGRRLEATPSTVVQTAAETSSTTVTTATSPSLSTASAAPETPVKPTPTTRRLSTPTTAAAAVTTTTRPAVTTSTTAAATTTTKPYPTANCSVNVAKASVHKGDPQVVSVTSGSPATKTRLTIQYPKFDTGKLNPTQTYMPTTDGSGAVTQGFVVVDTSTVPVEVTVEFFIPGTSYVMRGGCSTTFQST